MANTSKKKAKIALSKEKGAKISSEKTSRPKSNRLFGGCEYNVIPFPHTIQWRIWRRGEERSLQGFDPLSIQRVPLCIVLRYPFLVMDHKNFSKGANIYINFEGGARAEKAQFFGEKFQKKKSL